MKVSGALSLFTHLIALTGFVALSITGEIGIPAMAVFSFSFLISIVNDRYGGKYYVRGAVSAALALVLVIYISAQLLFLGVELFKAILEFLVFIQALKLLGARKMRDVLQIYVLSFFQFVAGTIITVSFSYALAFIIYIAVAVWALMVFEMRSESLDADSGGDPEVVTPLFLSTTFVVGICIFLVAALIFVTVPRLRGSYFSAAFLRSGEIRSGFSSEVKLGRVGEIKLDSSPVMMVRILNADGRDIPSPIYWRGVALDEFDGESWKAGGGEYEIHRADRDGIVTVWDNTHAALAQEIITEPLDTDVLFAASFPFAFGSVLGGRVSEVNDSYFLPGRVSNRIKYTAYSDLTVPDAGMLRKAGTDYGGSVESRYLQLPRLEDSVRALADEITALEDNNYDKAVSVKRYLLNNYSYTRTLERGAAEFPLEDFLFVRREGHCEYFATAMVVLLREAGVPSRIVNGFLGGEWNEHGEFFLIRESDAHSWVEVFFPGYGWVTFDPTPAAGDAGGGGPFIFVTSYIDYLRYRWSRYVIDFSQRDQVRLFNELRDRWRWQNKKISRVLSFDYRPDTRFLAALALVLLLTLIVLYGRRISAAIGNGRKGKAQRASVIYERSLKLLSKRGYDKPGFMTAREFSSYLKRRSYKGCGIMERLTEVYLSVRFGGDADESAVNKLSELLGRLRSIKK